MTSYRIDYLPDVVRYDMRALSKPTKVQIAKAINSKLIRDPVAFGKPLKYHFFGERSLRVGSYRVIYQVDRKAQTVLVTKIGHRSEVYEE